MIFLSFYSITKVYHCIYVKYNISTVDETNKYYKKLRLWLRQIIFGTKCRDRGRARDLRWNSGGFCRSHTEHSRQTYRCHIHIENETNTDKGVNEKWKSCSGAVRVPFSASGTRRAPASHIYAGVATKGKRWTDTEHWGARAGWLTLTMV